MVIPFFTISIEYASVVGFHLDYFITPRMKNNSISKRFFKFRSEIFVLLAQQPAIFV